MLETCFKSGVFEAGVDEAGRGCLAGEVYAAAVILPDNFHHPLLNDSKQLTENARDMLVPIIKENAIAWAIGTATAEEIDEINILNASILAMHRALDELAKTPNHIAVDGNRFKPWGTTPFTTIVRGDGKYANIAAASILAKTARDRRMKVLHDEFPNYNWAVNKGYPTKAHRQAIADYGVTSYHRKTFRLLPSTE